jgi:hypothetical protein
MVGSSEGMQVEVDLVFHALGGAVQGRVTGADGSPVAGAEVVVGTDDYAQLRFPDGATGRPAASQRAFAGEDGAFRIDGVAEGRHVVRARARRGDLAPWEGEVEVAAGRASPLAIVLPAGATLEGVVRDAGGSPVARAVVTIERGHDLGGRHQRTRDDGSFSIRGAPLGEFEAEASAGERGSARGTLVGSSGATLRWDPVLGRGLVLRVRLVAPGRELAGWWAMVEHYGAGGSYGQADTTDEHGRMEFVGCPDAPLRLRLHAPGGGHWPAATREDVRAGGEEIVIEPDPAFEPSVRLRGRVVNPLGEPVGGVRLNPSLRGYPMAPVLMSEPDGRFDIGPCPPGVWTLLANTTGYVQLRSESRRLEPGETWDLGDLVLQHGGTVVASVRRERGLEDARAGLMLLSDAPAEWTTEWMRVEGDSAVSGPVAPGRSRLVTYGD